MRLSRRCALAHTSLEACNAFRLRVAVHSNTAQDALDPVSPQRCAVWEGSRSVVFAAFASHRQERLYERLT